MWTIPRIKENKEFEYVSEDRSSFMVDLSIVDKDSFRGPNKPANELNRHLSLKRRLSTCITQDQIVDYRFRCNILAGVPGIGKTSTVESVALSWGRDPLYSFTNEKSFRYIFLFSCRKLNEYRNRSITFEQLFEYEFNIQLKMLSNVDGRQVLIIVDGIDEIESLASIFETTEIDEIYQLLHEMIKDQSCIFPGHTTLIVGRPHTISTLKRFQHQIGPIRVIQILGFDSRSISTYVDKFCHGNEALLNRIMDKINGSATVKAMAAIPQLLSSICSIYSWEFTDLHVEKKTELFVWTIISFLKHQFSQFNGMLPRQLMKEDAVKKFLSAIAKLSYDLIFDNRILFDVNEVKELQTSDPLLKALLDAFVQRIDTFSSHCQFTHLIVQEFFAAVHCYVSGKTIGSLLEREFYDIAEFYAGFACADQNCLETDDDDIVALFIRNVPPRFRRSFRKSFTKPRKPSIPSLASEVFSLLEGWKISCDTFCSIFYELISVDDTVPDCITFPRHADIILSGLTPLQVVRLNHFLTCILRRDENGHSPLALNNVIVTIKRTEFTDSSEYRRCLQLLPSFREVAFVNCSFGGHVLEDFACTARTNGSLLEKVSFKSCNIIEDDLCTLAKCIPKIRRFSFESVKLGLRVTEAIVYQLIHQDHSLSFKLIELELCNCGMNDFCTEELRKALHLIEVVNLSDNAINSVRMYMLVNWWTFRKRCEPDIFKLKTLILRNCSGSPTIARQLKQIYQANLDASNLDLFID